MAITIEELEAKTMSQFETLSRESAKQQAMIESLQSELEILKRGAQREAVRVDVRIDKTRILIGTTREQLHQRATVYSRRIDKKLEEMNTLLGQWVEPQKPIPVTVTPAGSVGFTEEPSTTKARIIHGLCQLLDRHPEQRVGQLLVNVVERGHERIYPEGIRKPEADRVWLKYSALSCLPDEELLARIEYILKEDPWRSRK
tara:strand:+ start:2187 stop:2789 length:603 start_codon:yes stop_codon:yes gene_type:complete